MKFLFDQSADFRLIAYLRERGRDVLAVSRDFPPGLADADVLAIARQEQRIFALRCVWLQSSTGGGTFESKVHLADPSRQMQLSASFEPGVPAIWLAGRPARL